MNYCQRIKGVDELAAGDQIYYTGDVANEDWWGTITEMLPGGFAVIKIDDPTLLGAVTTVAYWNIGAEYKGHGNPRFYTEAAVKGYRAKQIASMKAAFSHANGSARGT